MNEYMGEKEYRGRGEKKSEVGKKGAMIGTLKREMGVT
jgi:hypothetical protein